MKNINENSLMQDVQDLRQEVEHQLQNCSGKLDIEIDISKYQDVVSDFEQLEGYGEFLSSVSCIVDVKKSLLLINIVHLEHEKINVLLYC
jgi:hypothetical protein